MRIYFFYIFYSYIYRVRPKQRTFGRRICIIQVRVIVIKRSPRLREHTWPVRCGVYYKRPENSFECFVDRLFKYSNVHFIFIFNTFIRKLLNVVTYFNYFSKVFLFQTEHIHTDFSNRFSHLKFKRCASHGHL